MFTYKSPVYHLGSTEIILESVTNNGITCEWSGRVTHLSPFTNDTRLSPFTNATRLSPWAFSRTFESTWVFKWDDMIARRPEKLSGYILLKRGGDRNPPIRIDICSENGTDIVVKVLTSFNSSPIEEPYASFEYYLTPTFSSAEENPIEAEFPIDAMFLPSEQTDACLVVDGKQMHVNKSLLSFHSDYFRALFSSNYREGKMDEIPIEEVSYEDLGLLLSIIHPMNNFPTDETVEKLLELADRFMMPSVTRQVEHHLLNLSKIENKKMMVMADRYKMPSILKKTVREVNSAAKAKQIQSSPEYNNFSDNTKLALFERIFQFL